MKSKQSAISSKPREENLKVTVLYIYTACGKSPLVRKRVITVTTSEYKTDPKSRKINRHF